MTPVNRKSSVDLLPDELRDAINKAIRDGRSTIDQILAHLETIAPPGTELPSRSAIGRYKKREEAAMAAMSRALRLGDVWTEKFGEDPKGDVGLLVSQLLKTRAFDYLMARMDEEPTDDDPKALAMLARMNKDTTRAELESNILSERKRNQKECMARIDKVEAEVAANPDMDKAAMLKRIREEIYGVFE